MQMVHCQIDTITMGTTDKTLIAVLAEIEVERRMVVGVEGTEREMAFHPKAQSLCDPLNGEVAKPLDIFIVDHEQLNGFQVYEIDF